MLSFIAVNRAWHSITSINQPDNPFVVTWPQSSAFHRCVTVSVDSHQLQQNATTPADDTVTLMSPFQRGATASSSADSGYAASLRRNSNSYPSCSREQPPVQPRPFTSRSRHESPFSSRVSPIDSHHQSQNAHQFLEAAAADNHAYSDEEDLGIVQEYHAEDEDNCSSFALPGSVIGFYDEEKKYKQRQSVANVSRKNQEIEMKPYPRPSAVAIFERVREEIPVDVPRNFVPAPPSVEKVEPKLQPPQTQTLSRSTSIYLVGSGSPIGKYLTIWKYQPEEGSS